MPYAKVVVQYPDDSTIVVEVGDAGPAHPDLLDELVQRVARLFE